ncbi:MAG: low molecular weight protein-tyrosine-phosphatase [Bacillus sp. (in: firmicutes)]
MIHVLFVCLGNICRSPMAEAIFRDMVKREGLEQQIMVDSAGTGDWHVGNAPHHGTRQLLDEKGISYEGIKARQIAPDDFHTFHYIIGMDESNMENMKKVQQGDTEAYVGRLLDLVPEALLKDVPDPYFTGNFDEVHDLVKEGCEQLLKKIRNEQNI